MKGRENEEGCGSGSAAACATITPPPNRESTRIVVEGVTHGDVVEAFTAVGMMIAEANATFVRTPTTAIGVGGPIRRTGRPSQAGVPSCRAPCLVRP